MEPMNAGRRPDALDRFRRWGAVAVAAAVVGWMGYALFRGFTETAVELQAFRWTWYVPILLLTLVNYGLRYLKWHYLLGQLGVHMAHRDNLLIFATGLAMVISPAKAGEVVKPYLVREVTGTPMTKTIPALVAERTTDGIAVVALAAVGVTTYYAEATNLILMVTAGVVVSIVAVSIEPIAMAGIGILSAIPVVGRIGPHLEEAYRALRVCLAPVPLLVTVAMSIVAWFAECIGYWFVFLGMQVGATLGVSTFLYAFATVFGAPSPGGMGMADLALAEGAIGLIPEVSAGQAVAASLLIRVATLWFGVIIGAIALLRVDGLIARARNHEVV
jgi:glycosyltransferase 2 family protein